MRKVLITESSLRDLLRELMNSHAPIFPNPVVDPQAAETDPTNQNFVPSDKTELMSALKALVDPVDDERVPQVYVAVKDAIEKEEAEMKDTQVESIIRKAVRKILKEELLNEVLPVSPPPKMPIARKLPISQELKDDQELTNMILNFDPTLQKKTLLKTVADKLKKRGIKDTASAELEAQSIINKVLEPRNLAAKQTFLQTKSVSTLPTSKPSSYGPGNPSWEKAVRQQRDAFQNKKFYDLKTSDDELSSDDKRKNKMMGDVGGEGLKELAQDFGFKNPNGVLQWINKLLEKVKLRLEHYEIVSEVVLETLNEFIQQKVDEKEFSEDQVKKWKEPGNEETLKEILGVIQTDAGFREMLSPKIDRALKMLKKSDEDIEEV